MTLGSLRLGKNRQPASQPLKAIENVATQGQIAKYEIISTAYIQHALVSMKKIQFKKVDSTIRSVGHIFVMSTRALDQVGPAVDVHYIICGKAAATDSGLNNLKEVQAKMFYLPLTEDGVFGKGLEENLKKRKEQKEQLSDLVPDLVDYKPENF